MKIKRSSTVLPALCLAMGTIVAGCNQSSMETGSVTEATGDSLVTTASTNDPGCCADANETTTGCCGKCAEEQVGEPAANCGDCMACAEGNSSDCKCAGETPVSTATSKEQDAKNKAKTQEKQSADKVLSFAEDRDIFHFLLANNDKLTRTVTELENGVKTLTESSDPAIVEKIQTHVASMYRRVEDVRPIRMRDPLYRELFQHTDNIEMKLENTDNGIQVTETSDDEYVVKLIQAHAKVVSGFVDRGFEEARKNHQPPKK